MSRLFLPPQDRQTIVELAQVRRGLPELDLEHDVQLYPRVSTKEQMANVSTEMQQDITFVLNYGWPLHRIIMDKADLGKSGQLRMDEREAFLGMLHRIRIGQVKTIIAAQVDRFFREKWGVEYGKFMQICYEYNVKVVTLTHDRRNIDFIYDFHISWHIDQFRRECEAAYRYLEKQIGRMQGARNELQMQGFWCCGGIAPGFLPDYRERIDGKLNPNYYRYMPYVPHAERIHWMTRRFRELTGNVNVLLQEIRRTPIFLPAFPPEIAALPFITQYSGTRVLSPDQVDEDGKPIILGYTFGSQNGLRYALTNPANIGHWAVNNQIVRYNNHLAIVDEGDYLYAIEHLSPTFLDGTPNPFFETKRSFYMKQHYASSPAVLQNHLISLDPGFTIRPRTYAKKGEHAKEGETLTGYGFIARLSACRNLKYIIAADEIDGFFFYLLKQKLQGAEEFEDYYEREQKEKEERENALGAIDMQIVACDRAMKKLTKRLVQLSIIEAEEEESLTDEEKEGKEKKEKELVKAIRDEFNRFSSERDALTKRRETLVQQTSQSQKRRTYKELILKVLKYWPDTQVYPPEALIPPDELPMIVDTFVTHVGLDTLSPHFYKMVISWRDPAWGEDTLICFRGGQPSIQWSDEEDAILRAHYATTTRDEIMRLLPMRSYGSIQSRASFYRIHKAHSTVNTENFPYRFSFQDYTIMQEIDISEEALQSGEGVINLAGASLVSLCKFS